MNQFGQTYSNVVPEEVPHDALDDIKANISPKLHEILFDSYLAWPM